MEINFNPIIILAVWTGILFWDVGIREKRLFLQLTLLISLVVTTWYNAYSNIHNILWLCNITCALALYLSFNFQQKLFGLFFFFVWSGNLLTLLIWPNPVAPDLLQNPMSWVTFYLKHIAPMILVWSLVKHEKRQIRPNAVIHTIIFMVIYIFILYPYNIYFDQNIMDLVEPTINIEKAFGPWPNFVIANIILALISYFGIYLVAKKLDIIEL